MSVRDVMKDNKHNDSRYTLSTRLLICLFKEVSEKYSKARDFRKIYTIRHTGRKKKNCTKQLTLKWDG